MANGPTNIDKSHKRAQRAPRAPPSLPLSLSRKFDRCLLRCFQLCSWHLARIFTGLRSNYLPPFLPLSLFLSSLQSSTAESMAVSALKAVFFLWVCLAVPSILANPVKYCDKKANYAVKVKRVEIQPNPVKSGEPAVFKIYASSGKDISGGFVIINVSYVGIPVHSEKIDLCKETSCPISAGDFVLSHSQTLPSFTPPGPYNLKMQMQDGSNNPLTCISFPFKIILGSSVSAI